MSKLKKHRKLVGMSQNKLAYVAKIPRYVLTAIEHEGADVPEEYKKKVFLSLLIANEKKIKEHQREIELLESIIKSK